MMKSPQHDSGKSAIAIKRLGHGHALHTVTPIIDASGRIIHHVVKPLMVELHAHDIIQIIVGATLLAIPVGFTEEAWRLAEKLPAINIILLMLLSLGFIALFVYLNFYRHFMRQFLSQYIKRVIVIYLLSLLLVGILLTIIQQCPWGIDNMLALKRIIIVALPASLSATLTDALK